MRIVRFPEPLRDIAAKLHRADESAEYLNGLVNEFIRQNEGNNRITKDFDANGTRYSFKVSSEIPIDHRIPIIAGEIIHHLRSIFDHLIVALVKQNRCIPHARNQFPVAKTRKKFEQAVNDGYVNGVSPSALKRVEAHQPFQQSVPENTVLSILHYLDVIDKHRLLLMPMHVASFAGELAIRCNSPGVKITKVTPPGSTVPVSEVEQEFFFFEVTPPHPQLDADMEPVYLVAFEKVGAFQNYGVTELIAELRERTKTIVVDFIPEFQ